MSSPSMSLRRFVGAVVIVLFACFTGLSDIAMGEFVFLNFGFETRPILVVVVDSCTIFLCRGQLLLLPSWQVCFSSSILKCLLHPCSPSRYSRQHIRQSRLAHLIKVMIEQLLPVIEDGGNRKLFCSNDEG